MSNALSYYTPGSKQCCPILEWPVLLSLGGGDASGFFSKKVLEDIDDAAITQIMAHEYLGIVYHVEEVHGKSAEMIPAFAASFAKV